MHDLTHPAIVDAVSNVVPSGGSPSTPSQNHSDAQENRAGGVSPSTPTSHSPIVRERASGWVELRLIAGMYQDAQQHRIALANRGRSEAVDPMVIAAVLEAAEHTEHLLKLALGRTFRRVVPEPIREWQASSVGIGAHLLARLLGETGNPAVAIPHHWEGEGASRTLVADDPYARSVSQLRSYCGHGDPTRKRRKGMDWEEGAALGNPRAKMLTRLLAEACMKQRTSPYRPLYEQARVEYATREGWTLLHQHNAALRLVGKALLKDLWTAAHVPADDQRIGGGGPRLEEP